MSRDIFSDESTSVSITSRVRAGQFPPSETGYKMKEKDNRFFVNRRESTGEKPPSGHRDDIQIEGGEGERRAKKIEREIDSYKGHNN